MASTKKPKRPTKTDDLRADFENELERQGKETKFRDDLTLLAELANAISVWKPAPASREPVVTLYDWRVYKVKAAGVTTVHFVGNNGREGRVSSAVDSYDKLLKEGKTKSGRTYILMHDPGHSGDAEYTWHRWLANMGNPETIDVTGEYE